MKPTLEIGDTVTGDDGETYKIVYVSSKYAHAISAAHMPVIFNRHADSMIDTHGSYHKLWTVIIDSQPKEIGNYWVYRKLWSYDKGQAPISDEFKQRLALSRRFKAAFKKFYRMTPDQMSRVLAIFDEVQAEQDERRPIRHILESNKSGLTISANEQAFLSLSDAAQYALNQPAIEH